MLDREEKSLYNFKDLSRLVKSNNLIGVKEVVTNAQKSALQEYGKDTDKVSWTYADDDKHIENAMRDAILLGHDGIVKFLLEQGVNPNNWVHINRTATVYTFHQIYFAIIKNNLPLVELLLKYGAIIDPKNPYDDIYLYTAIENGFHDIVKCLLQHRVTPNEVLTFRDKYNVSYLIFCLGYAANINRRDIVELLITQGADISRALKLNYENFISHYNQAEYYIKYGEVEKRDELLKDRNVLIETYRSSTFILMDYALGVDFDSLDFLKEIDITEMNFIGISVQGQPITCEILKDLGLTNAEKAITKIQQMPDINVLDMTTAHLSSFQSRLIHAFVKHGGTIDKQSGIVNLVPLWKAVEKGDIESIKARLKSKEENPNLGNPNYPYCDTTASIPINIALKNRRLDIAKCLIEHPLFDNNDLEIAIDLIHKRFIKEYEELSKDILLQSYDDLEKHTQRKNVIIKTYGQTISTLLDLASGTDFRSLEFLKNIDITGMNFLGISIDGKPITHETLIKLGLPALEKTITTLDKLKQENSIRFSVLQAGLDRGFKKHGRIIDKRSGLVILAPLWKAVKNGDIATVKARLEWKEENPNIGGYLGERWSFNTTPILIAIQNNRIDIIECLLKHPLFDLNNLNKIISCSKMLGSPETTNYLTAYQEMLAFSMGMHPRLGQESSIFKFFGAPAYNKNPNGTDAMHPDRNVLKITKEFLM